jgi:hypothetical protein
MDGGFDGEGLRMSPRRYWFGVTIGSMMRGMVCDFVSRLNSFLVGSIWGSYWVGGGGGDLLVLFAREVLILYYFSSSLFFVWCFQLFVFVCSSPSK